MKILGHDFTHRREEARPCSFAFRTTLREHGTYAPMILARSVCGRVLIPRAWPSLAGRTAMQTLRQAGPASNMQSHIRTWEQPSVPRVLVVLGPQPNILRPVTRRMAELSPRYQPDSGHLAYRLFILG